MYLVNYNIDEIEKKRNETHMTLLIIIFTKYGRRIAKNLIKQIFLIKKSLLTISHLVRLS